VAWEPHNGNYDHLCIVSHNWKAEAYMVTTSASLANLEPTRN